VWLDTFLFSFPSWLFLYVSWKKLSSCIMCFVLFRSFLTCQDDKSCMYLKIDEYIWMFVLMSSDLGHWALRVSYILVVFPLLLEPRENARGWNLKEFWKSSFEVFVQVLKKRVPSYFYNAEDFCLCYNMEYEIVIRYRFTNIPVHSILEHCLIAHWNF